MSTESLEKFTDDVENLCAALRAFPGPGRLNANLKVINNADIEELGITEEELDKFRQKMYHAFLRGHILYNGHEYKKTDMGKLMILSFDESTGLNPIAIFTNNIAGHLRETNGAVLPEMKIFMDEHLAYLTEHYSRL